MDDIGVKGHPCSSLCTSSYKTQAILYTSNTDPGYTSTSNASLRKFVIGGENMLPDWEYAKGTEMFDDGF